MKFLSNLFKSKPKSAPVYFKSLQIDQIIHSEDTNLIGLLIEKTQENKIQWEVPPQQETEDMIWSIESLDNVSIKFRRLIKVDREAKVKRVIFVLRLGYEMRTTIGDYSPITGQIEPGNTRSVIRSYEGNKGSLLSELYDAINHLDTTGLLKQVSKSSDILESL